MPASCMCDTSAAVLAQSRKLSGGSCAYGNDAAASSFLLPHTCRCASIAWQRLAAVADMAAAAVRTEDKNTVAAVRINKGDFKPRTVVFSMLTAYTLKQSNILCSSLSRCGEMPVYCSCVELNLP